MPARTPTTGMARARPPSSPSATGSTSLRSLGQAGPTSGYAGPTRLLCLLEDETLGYADFRGNRRYVTTGNVAANDRVSLFLTDHVHQRRLKIFGRVKVVDAGADPALAKELSVQGYPGRVERAVLTTIEAFDRNCPQRITPRFTEAGLAAVPTQSASRWFP
jgi:predicted pyridoxine 5'-phosphate oxidase superfamily flavin-nucleotide-binding protein